MMLHRKIALLLSGGAVALAGPVCAQTVTAAESVGVGDIIVTARKKAESLQNVPLSITGIGAEEIADRDISSIGNIDTLAPSVFVEAARRRVGSWRISAESAAPIPPVCPTIRSRCISTVC